ncbi:THAP domain-containing protein 1 [Armadillidium vulgare]|nr:THAP domain-containing protein 1 [Armadillidium vulgare]
MGFCSAINCSNKSTLNCGKSFFRFPLTNKKLTKIWVMKMKRGKFYPSKFSKICSDHFTPDCINPGVGFLKKRKEQEYFETESKVPSPKQVQELNNLQDLNTQSFDFHDQPISKPANYLVTSISDPSQNFEEISQTQEIGAFEEVALTSEEIFPAMDVVTPKLTSKNNKEIFHSAIINDHSYDISLQAKLTKAKLEIKRLKNKCSAYQNFIKNSKSKNLYFLGSLSYVEANKEYLSKKEKKINTNKYIMSYKFSQDSIEIFFSIIRSRLGNNNNPTPLHLRHCLRKILIGRIN